jgi:hypothetical protein
VLDLVGKTEGKRPLERPRRRWEDNTKADIKGIGWEGVDWLYLDEDRKMTSCCEHGNELSGVIQCVECFD